MSEGLSRLHARGAPCAAA